MGFYRSNSSSDAPRLKQQVVLPTYKLDSNLVLLPGIIYNVAFSRFKAAALLYRFKDLVSQISIVNNLLNEYDFDSREGVKSPTGQVQQDPESSNPSKISREAIEGISSFFRYETLSKTAGMTEDQIAGPGSEFEWLTVAIIPNLDKIKSPQNYSSEGSNVVTAVRIIGIVDDTTNIKLTLQAITRCVKVDKKNTRSNEQLVEIDWSYRVRDLKANMRTLQDNAGKLFKSIDKFLGDYRQALNNPANKNRTNLSLTSKTTDETNKNNPVNLDNNPDLLTLNPLANALYLQLAGSKDFSKAFLSLQKLYSQYSSGEDLVIDNKSYLRLMDLTCGILPFPNYEKLNILNKYRNSERAIEINEMIVRLMQIFENLRQNTSFVNHWFHNEATNIQKANVVANELKSIRILLEGMTNRERAEGKNPRPARLPGRPPHRRVAGTPEDDYEDDDEDDELKAITNFIRNKLPGISSLSSDSKRLIVKDFKRIKSSANSPGGGNSDYHVLRNYLEIVMDIPWDKYVTKFKSNKEIDLKLAKKQLDDDHYGLEHVKKRLIQYLVVLKLLGINAEREIAHLKNEKKLIQSNNSSALKTDQELKDAGSNSIVIANHDETYHVRQKAKQSFNKTINESKLDKISDESIEISRQNKSPIIMLAGPPGTGKTSLAKSIATALGRNFQRISLGGIKDESEIRGHRRTYVGAMPGLIIQALRKARSMNPVILLDEIDKVVGGNSGLNKFNGDPSAALLEVLDPEQNNTFIDHYLGFPIDLSQVIFICTANEPHQMARPLLDRLEMIQIGAYDYNEKLVIGRKYLLPRQVKRNGFPVAGKIEEFVNIDEAALKKIIIDYTREAGVRNLERKLGTLCRFKAVEYCESIGNPDTTYSPNIEECDLPIYLGVPFGNSDFTAAEGTTIGNSKVGVVNGLSYNSEGSGSVLVFESIGFDRRLSNPNASGDGATLNMTGRLGEVLMESGKIGLIFIKSMIYKNLLKIANRDDKYLLERFNNTDIHMHVPMGSISKDGPSAGITMALSFLSVLLDKPVPSDIAMTGEITLRGLVLPIGGVKEKLLGAHLNVAIKKMIVPRENRKDLIEEYSRSIEEVGEVVDQNLVNELLKDNEEHDFKMTQVEQFYQNRYGIQIFYAREFYDVIRIVWEDDDLLSNHTSSGLLEYHL
ncbi:uncharacterized protein J8A68_003244 [[Candida] subhashii]|uniref:Lon protease homolog 2, peroxisomal n=1 Tax=[Candida] subhashii TaxID=561895 RepID=A0A8J5UYP6_9ASCO|nr:uncharacterized protein J8A68_003244 [[Candida] subhashii]KAG7663244.1 hypothetical protein J8A68_003244 [[Candida] subhashii]